MTRTRGTTRSTGDVALALLLAAAACGCDVGSPASPTFEGGVTVADATVDAGDAAPKYAICPPGMDASFGSIYGEMLSTTGCGTDRRFNCHSTSGASAAGTGNGLDLSEAGAAVYKELIDVPAVNLDGNRALRVLRVVPGDASASFLYIKLTLTTKSKVYGAGMPVDTPGSVCPAALEAVKAWIDQGAAQN
jgi:hypothetical protein